MSESAESTQRLTYLTTSYGNFRITRASDGVYADVENGAITSGNLDVYVYSINNAPGFERSITYVVPKLAEGDYYVIEPDANDVSIVTGNQLTDYSTSLYNNDSEKGSYMSIDADKAGRLEFYQDGRILCVFDEDTQDEQILEINARIRELEQQIVKIIS